MRIKSKSLFGSSLGGRPSTFSAAERRMGRLMREGEHPNDPPRGFDFPDSVDSLDGVPAKAKPLYKKDEATGRFVYDDITGLKNALEHEKREKGTLKGQLSQLSAFKELGITADEARELLEQRRTAEEQRLIDAGDFKSLKEQMEANHAASLADKDAVISRYKKFIEKTLVSDNARAVLASDDIKGNATLLLPVIRDRVEVAESDGEFQLVVKRPDGTPMLNEANGPATLKDLFMELRKAPEYADAFKGVNQSGGGAPNNPLGGGAPNGSLVRGKMSVKEKTAYISANGQEAYNNLPYN